MKIFWKWNLPEVTLIDFADDAIKRVKMWIEIRKLQMALEKTKILLVTDKRSFDCH